MMQENKIIAKELNAIIQTYLYEKLGDGAHFTVQYNDDNIHVWVKVANSQGLEGSKEQ